MAPPAENMNIFTKQIHFKLIEQRERDEWKRRFRIVMVKSYANLTIIYFSKAARLYLAFRVLGGV